MTTSEMELKGLMLASLDGDAASYRTLLDKLSSRLRAYYKGKFARVGRGATEAEDLAQEVLLAIHLKRHTVHRGMVRRHGCAVHPGRRSIGTAAVALVSDVVHVCVNL